MISIPLRSIETIAGSQPPSLDFASGIAVGVENTGPPVAEGLVVFLAVGGELEVAARDFEFSAASSQDHDGSLFQRSVVLVSRRADVDDYGVVEHVAITFWNCFQLVGEGGENFKMMAANDFAALEAIVAIAGFVVPDSVDRFFAQTQSFVIGC